jgi:hypothetical protein
LEYGAYIFLHSSCGSFQRGERDSVVTLETGRMEAYIVDSASYTARLVYDTGAASKVFVNGYPSSFYADVKIGPAPRPPGTIPQTAEQNEQAKLEHSPSL